MNLYSLNSKNNIEMVQEKPFALEKDIQLVFESNLNVLMGLQFVRSEFNIRNKRIDTLAYDTQSNSFVIIEYKRNKSNSVVDQGFTYLSLMLENKADFIVEYNETLKTNLKRKDVDWSQSKVVFVSTSFTENQKAATNFKDMAIELWEVKRYENNVISINHIRKSKSAESIKPIISNNNELEAVTKEIITYTEEFHLEKYPERIRELYEIYRDAILNISEDIEIEPKKLYIAFKKNKNIADIVTLKKGLKLFINLPKDKLEDPKKLMRDVSGTGHWGNGDYEVIITNADNLEYILYLIKQAI